MQTKTAKPNSDWSLEYISYATMSDVWHAVKYAILAWLVMSIVFLICCALVMYVIEYFKPHLPDTGSIRFPKWIWILLIPTAWSAFFWIMDGRTITFPKMGRAWCIISGLLLLPLVFVIYFKADWWIAGPVYIGLIIVIVFLDSLVEKGKENFAKMSQPPSEEL